MKKFILICLCLLLALPVGCAKEGKKRYQAEFLSLFDTVTMIVGYSDSKENFTSLAEQIREKLKEYHELYDIYNDYEGINNIKTINDNAGIAPVVVDEAIVSMLLFAKQEYAATGGAVNVALGSVLSIWHEYREAGLDDPQNASLPPIELLEEASLHTDIEDVLIDPDASTVYLRDPLMRLDVGAIAKGYATEQTALYFESLGCDSLLLSVGGNVRAIGGKPADAGGAQTPWSVGIQNPDKSSPETELMTLSITDYSMVSSGSYERYYTVDGIEYHHIIDPKTLMPSRYFRAVTIVCPDSGLADGLSTAIFTMPLDEGRDYIDSLPGIEALWVQNDGTLEYSDGFKAFVNEQ